jgi:putative colanic acid biosynthesis glycosyltransferase
MKVAQIDTVYGIGSTGKIVKTLHENLIKEGHYSKSYYGRGAKVNENDVVKITNDFEVLIDAGLSRLTGYTGIFSPLSSKKIISDLEQFKPDVVHIHEIHGYYLNYFEIIDYFKFKNIPILWTLHCESAYTGRCGSAFECEQWKTACIKCPSLSGYPESLIFDRSSVQFQRKKALFNSIEKIVFSPVSNWLNDRLKNSFLKDKSSFVVHNGINTVDVFYPREVVDLIVEHDLSNRHVVLTVAPDLFSENKGGKWVLDIAEKMIDYPVIFIMVGVTEKKTDLPANVICLPIIKDQNKLAEYYSLADVYLLTSKSETFSLTCAESLACGTPVIGFDSGGPLEVAPEPYGFFVPYGKSDDLVSLIKMAISGNLNSADGEACRTRATTLFSNQNMCEKYIEIYEKIVKTDFKFGAL